MVKLGRLSIDGTKVQANASKRKAMSYGRMQKAEQQLERQIEELVKQAAETDAAGTASRSAATSCRRS